MNPQPARHPLAGMALGVLAVALFGATLPVTRWTLDPGGAGSAMSPWFITFGRVVVAAGASALFLLAVRADWPRREDWGPLAVAAAGNAVLYPLSLALALRAQNAAHVAVITALLPLATAAAAALAAGAARGHTRFWACAFASTVLVAAYSMQRSTRPYALVLDDLIVAGGVLAAAVGYVQGARMTRRLGAERVICWVTLLTLPVSLPVSLATWPEGPVPGRAWLGFGYLALVSMWAAFFAWYRALDWGGPLRVSQTQAFQPFFSIAFAWPLLGEQPDMLTLAFGVLVVGLVVLGTRR